MKSNVYLYAFRRNIFVRNFVASRKPMHRTSCLTQMHLLALLSSSLTRVRADADSFLAAAAAANLLRVARVLYIACDDTCPRDRRAAASLCKQVYTQLHGDTHALHSKTRLPRTTMKNRLKFWTWAKAVSCVSSIETCFVQTQHVHISCL
jgi:hypothetical protein